MMFVDVVCWVVAMTMMVGVVVFGHMDVTDR